MKYVHTCSKDNGDEEISFEKLNVNSPHVSIQIKDLEIIQKSLSCEADKAKTNFKQIEKTEIIQDLFKVLHTSKNEVVLNLSCDCLTNLCFFSTPCSNLVLKKVNLLKVISFIIQQNNVNMSVQALWLLTNVLGDSIDLINMLFSYNGFFDRVLELSKTLAGENLTTVVLFLVNCFRKKKPVGKKLAIKYYLKVFDVFAYQFTRIFKGGEEHQNESETLIEVLWGLSYVTDFNPKITKGFVISGEIKPLVRLLSYPKERVLFPTLRMIGNYIAENDECYLRLFLKWGLLKYLKKVLRTKKYIQKEYVWVISNLAVSKERGVLDALIRMGYISDVVVMLAAWIGENPISTECLYVIYNSFACSTQEQFQSICTKRLVKTLFDLLETRQNLVLCINVIGMVLYLSKKFGKQEQEHMKQLGLKEELMSIQSDNSFGQKIHKACGLLCKLYLGD